MCLRSHPLLAPNDLGPNLHPHWVHWNPIKAMKKYAAYNLFEQSPTDVYLVAEADEVIAEKDKLIEIGCRDWASDHTFIQEIFRPIIGEKVETVDGGYSISCIETIVEEGVKELQSRLAAKDEVIRKLRELVGETLDGARDQAAMPIDSWVAFIGGKLDAILSPKP